METHHLEAEDYKALLEFYEIIIAPCFEEFDFSCQENTFTLNNSLICYTDVTGTAQTTNHFIIEVRNEYAIHLPLAEGMKLQIINKVICC